MICVNRGARIGGYEISMIASSAKNVKLAPSKLVLALESTWLMKLMQRVKRRAWSHVMFSTIITTVTTNAPNMPIEC